MPARKTTRNVGFAPIPATYSRLPHDDEAYVLHAFAKHSSHCKACASPYSTFQSGKSLCAKGAQRALDVSEYLFSKSGATYSVVDLERGERVQVEIPSDCLVVRGLLKALERGMRLRSTPSVAKPTVSYDKNHYVPSRRPTDHRDLDADLRSFSSSPEEFEEPYLYQTITPKKVSQHHKHGYVSGKHDRLKPSQKPKYYTIGSKGALPVPRGDEWYY